jgi:hypothetical protein
VPDDVAAVARNVVAHYQTQAGDLPAETRDNVDLRWLAEQLATDQRRHGLPLAAERPVAERLQGCCRDHTLLAVAVFRQHGVPARSRVGFAGYFAPDWHYDHVVPEFWDGARWRRFDPEAGPEASLVPDPADLDTGPHAPFQTAAEAFVLMRAGDLDATRYGAAPGTPYAGEQFVVGQVFYEVTHRYGDEVLLWDRWGAIPPVTEPVPPEVLMLVAEVSALLLDADAGDVAAESRLHGRYRSDERLSPGGSVVQASPAGGPPTRVALRR